MNKEKIMKRNEPRKVIQVSMKITKKLSTWLKEKKYSPTGIFVEACNDLGYQEKEEE